MSMKPFVSLLMLGAVLGGCAHLPPARNARGLYVDLRKAVQFRESSGDWVVDRLEVEDMQETIMASGCRTSVETREDLRMWVNTQIDAELGAGASGAAVPSEAAYREDGRVSGRVKELQRLERVRLLLDAADEASAECPYWTHADPRFAGIETDEGRFVVLAESVGAGALRVSDGDTNFGGGGGGRLMAALGVGRLTLGVGFGITAAATFVETTDGARSFEAVVSSEVPLLLRVTSITRVFDIVLSYRTLFQDSGARHGGRVEIGYGLTTPRVATLMPYGVLWVGYELFPAQQGGHAEHAILVGTRVGFDWDPGAAGR